MASTGKKKIKKKTKKKKTFKRSPLLCPFPCLQLETIPLSLNPSSPSSPLLSFNPRLYKKTTPRMKLSALLPVFLSGSRALAGSLVAPYLPPPTYLSPVGLDADGLARTTTHSLMARIVINPATDAENIVKIKKALKVTTKMIEKAIKQAEQAMALDDPFSEPGPKIKPDVKARVTSRLDAYFPKPVKGGKAGNRSGVLRILKDVLSDIKGTKDMPVRIAVARIADSEAYAVYTQGKHIISIKPKTLFLHIAPKMHSQESIAGTLLHELCHAADNKVVDKMYGKFRLQKLTLDQALNNADSYKAYAHDVWMDLDPNQGPPDRPLPADWVDPC